MIAGKLREWLNSGEFYELMQTYRHAPYTHQQVVVETYNAVRDAIVKKARELEAQEPGGRPGAPPSHTR